MYTLILLILSYSSSGALSTTSVPGFATLDECEVARSSFIAAVKNRDRAEVVTVCAKASAGRTITIPGEKK